MNLLIDTHVFLWYLSDSQKLSRRATELIDGQLSTCFISQASILEMSIKMSLGKLKIPGTWNDLFYYFEQARWIILPITNADCIALSSLPFHHGDPFDRIIACQAHNRNLSLLSKDLAFDSYGISRIWD